MLSDDQARALRLRSLLLATPVARSSSTDDAPAAGTPESHQAHLTPAGVVEWFGAMQAQDVASGHWSFGVRLPGSTDADIERATAERQIVRTWPMRGTIHFVPPADVTWMLQLTGIRMLRGLDRRWSILDTDRVTVLAAAEAIGDILSDPGHVSSEDPEPDGSARARNGTANPLTRAQILASLQQRGIDASGQRGYHYLWYACQTGVAVIGPQRGKEQTFALAADWLPPQRDLTRDEALRTLAERFFRSHGPAPAADFTGWTGLTASDTKAAVAALGSELTSVSVGDREMLCPTTALDVPGWQQGVRRAAPPLVLPGFDEFLLGYKDRTLAADAETMAAVIPGGNGVFRNTIVVGGRVAATWTRKVRAKRIDVEVHTLSDWRPSAAAQRRLAKAFDRFGEFLGRPASVSYT
ncbi:MAG: AlkZ family DNA glycosylase [Actinobacteria bacterium]|nr:AlkZ family DNA glycosylase [Actinomycetota bacterium]MCB9412198.1 AlkZ family DNA glycosylase [Actinomycetota bacterium]